MSKDPKRSEQPTASQYYAGPFIVMAFGVIALLVAAAELQRDGATQLEAMTFFVTAGGFWCVLISLIEVFVQARRQHRETTEALYLQALAN